MINRVYVAHGKHTFLFVINDEIKMIPGLPIEKDGNGEVHAIQVDRGIDLDLSKFFVPENKVTNNVIIDPILQEIRNMESRIMDRFNSFESRMDSTFNSFESRMNSLEHKFDSFLEVTILDQIKSKFNLQWINKNSLVNVLLKVQDKLRCNQEYLRLFQRSHPKKFHQVNQIVLQNRLFSRLVAIVKSARGFLILLGKKLSLILLVLLRLGILELQF
jgi:hypothetical protein